jgi:hypothetical protein
VFIFLWDLFTLKHYLSGIGLGTKACNQGIFDERMSDYNELVEEIKVMSWQAQVMVHKPCLCTVHKYPKSLSAPAKFLVHPVFFYEWRVFLVFVGFE